MKRDLGASFAEIDEMPLEEVNRWITLRHVEGIIEAPYENQGPEKWA